MITIPNNNSMIMHVTILVLRNSITIEITIMTVFATQQVVSVEPVSEQ